MAKRNIAFENIVNKNEKDSYYAYLSKSGIRKEEKYYDALAKADTDRALASSDYGARAEALTSSGLNASGYEDYIKSMSEERYSDKVRDAERQRSVNEYKNVQGYRDYVSNYEKLQSDISESVIKQIASKRNFNYKDALDEALRAGISRDLAYTTASIGIKRAKENTVKAAVSYAKLNSLSAKKAKAYALSLGLDETYAEKVYMEIANLSNYEKQFFSSMTAGDYYNYIKKETNN